MKRVMFIITINVVVLGIMTNCRRNKLPYEPMVLGPDSAQVNESVTFTASATDPDGDNVAIRFDWGDGNTSDWSSYVSSGQSVSMSHIWTSVGTYYVKAQAKDMNGVTSGWSSAHKIVITGANNPPNAPTISGPDSAQVNESVTFTASATDPDGDNVAIRFDWGDGNTSNWSSYVSSGQSVSMSHTYTTAGTYYVKAQAKDVNGALSGWSSTHEIVITGVNNIVSIDYYINGSYRGTYQDTPFTYEPDLQYVGLRSGDFIAFYDEVVIKDADGNVLWADDFESYPAGSWPSNWVQSGNASASGNEVIDTIAYAGSKCLQLKGRFGGCWEAIAYREFPQYNTLIFEFAVYPTGVGELGCHVDNGGIEFKTEPDWTYEGRGLIGFVVDSMKIYGPEWLYLGDFNFKEW